MAVITITQADVEIVYGVEFIAQWASFAQGRQASINVPRVTQACNLGMAYVNSRLAGSPYAKPLAQATEGMSDYQIVNAMATYAGWWLWNTRGLNYAKETLQWMTDLKQGIDNELLRIKTGTTPVDCALNTCRRQTPFVVG